MSDHRWLRNGPLALVAGLALTLAILVAGLPPPDKGCYAEVVRGYVVVDRLWVTGTHEQAQRVAARYDGEVCYLRAPMGYNVYVRLGRDVDALWSARDELRAEGLDVDVDFRPRLVLS